MSNYRCIPNGSFITHKQSCPTEWTVYKKNDNEFISTEQKKIYPSIYAFTVDHYKQERPDRVPGNNPWNECNFFNTDTQSWEYIRTLRATNTSYSNQVHI